MGVMIAVDEIINGVVRSFVNFLVSTLLNKLHLTSPASLPIHLYHKQAPIGGAVAAVAVAVAGAVTAVAVAAVAVAGIRAMDVVAATLMLISTNLLTLTLKIIPTMSSWPIHHHPPLVPTTMSMS